jgi:hypothetical protein
VSPKSASAGGVGGGEGRYVPREILAENLPRRRRPSEDIVASRAAESYSPRTEDPWKFSVKCKKWKVVTTNRVWRSMWAKGGASFFIIIIY